MISFSISEEVCEVFAVALSRRLTLVSLQVLKYSFVYIFLTCPRVIKPAMYFTRTFGIDHKKYFVNLLRGLFAFHRV